ncbi:hypothetical protein [Aquimarina sp. AU119]|uniref:hypothetical protein n=1 Tax=Aquimarina sp. AU119 TaxID=2108528 RepID=UPI001358DA45|nr:hypothetical protein [Aquimarina sp. AU119]
MIYKIYIISSIIISIFLISCKSNDKNQVDSNTENVTKKPPSLTEQDNNAVLQENEDTNTASTKDETSNGIMHHFICYTSDDNPDLAISISFDENANALQVQYKGQKESMTLSYIKEDFDKGGAYPTTRTYYTELYNGKENGVYKLTHAGLWDYAEYTRNKDGKKFNFTINHELSIQNDDYRTSPCF